MQLSCNNTLKTMINETMSAHPVNLLQFFFKLFLIDNQLVIKYYVTFFTTMFDF